MTTNRRVVATFLVAGMLLATFFGLGVWIQVAFGLLALAVVFLPSEVPPKTRSL